MEIVFIADAAYYTGMRSFLQFNEREMQGLWPLTGIFALRLLGLFMILPVFAIYARELNDVTPTLIGLALGVYGLSQALFQIPFGILSDKIGRKPLIVLGLSFFVLGAGIAAVSESIYGVILGRCLQGMGAIGSVVMAYVADLTRPEVRLQAMGLIGISIGVAFGFAIGLGPVLSDFLGLKGIFWLMVVFGLLALSLLPRVPKVLPLAQTTENLKLWRLLSKEVFVPKLLPCYLGVLVLHSSLIALFLKIPIYIERLGFSKGESFRFYLPVFSSAFILTLPILTRLGKKLSQDLILLIAISLWILSLISLFYFREQSLPFALSLLLFFIAFNVLEASLPSLVSRLASEGHRGAALGMYSSLQFFGLFLGGALGGFLDAQFGGLAVFLFCCILALVWLGLTLMGFLKRSFKDGEKFK